MRPARQSFRPKQEARHMPGFQNRQIQIWFRYSTGKLLTKKYSFLVFL